MNLTHAVINAAAGAAIVSAVTGRRFTPDQLAPIRCGPHWAIFTTAGMTKEERRGEWFRSLTEDEADKVSRMLDRISVTELQLFEIDAKSTRPPFDPDNVLRRSDDTDWLIEEEVAP